ncbi:MAG: polyphosphate kinase 2 [Pseudomonadota bacterium]
MGKNEKDASLSKKAYDKALLKLQVELCHLQEWVKSTGQRVVIVFEGRDAAGKGGVIKRITERVSPRVFRIVALPKPDDRELTQIYIQRYIKHMPAAGEIVLFDRSWYNRAGVERVMGFTSDYEVQRFLASTPRFEKYLVEDGIILIKYFFDVSRKVQAARFADRASDPRKHWKLSPMDVQSAKRWWAYTAAYAEMVAATDTDFAPWIRVPADDKRRARLNCISDLLSRIPYEAIPFEAPTFPKLNPRKKGAPQDVGFRHEVPALF